MSLKRTSACVALGVLVLLAATPSFGQGPLGLQLFAPADTSTFGGRQEPNDGYFFQYDGLWWNISAPPITTVGMEGLTRVVDYGPSTEVANWAAVESNSLDTSDFENMYSAGSRFEFGRVADRNGWMCTIFQLKRQGHD